MYVYTHSNKILIGFVSEVGVYFSATPPHPPLFLALSFSLSFCLPPSPPRSLHLSVPLPISPSLSRSLSLFLSLALSLPQTLAQEQTRSYLRLIQQAALLMAPPARTQIRIQTVTTPRYVCPIQTCG